ncbi:MAG: gliding motility protein GldB, partial [Prevotella sp.]|nr:gliding motility protein GldB [Prevotella sp.]
DINTELSASFERLKEEMPDMELPEVYTQVGAFDQSIVVGNNTLGISLDKYLGKDYPFYVKHYTEEQRNMMDRNMIVPDCLSFYILSLYPLSAERMESQMERDMHMGKIQWIVNSVTERQVFDNSYVAMIADFMKENAKLSFVQLLRYTDYSVFKK